MTVYISGPISGMPNKNKSAFSAASREIAKLKKNPPLRNMKIINPLRVGMKVDKAFAAKNLAPQWSDYMQECVKKLCDADWVYFLKGWEESEGASVERHIATWLKIPCAESLDELKHFIKKSAEAENGN